VAPISHPEKAFTLSTSDSAIDSIRDGNSLFILTYSGIEEWDLAKRKSLAKYPTYDYPGTMIYMQHPQAFARYGDTAIIAHGRLGVSFFNLKTRQLTNQYRLAQNQLPLESMATGVTVQGKYAYVVMNDYSQAPASQKPAFRGITVIDLDSQTVVSELDGMDSEADAVVSDAQSLIVSFGGEPIWKYGLADLASQTLPNPQNRIWRFPVDGAPTGRPAMDEKYYYTCFSKNPDYKKVPLALNRAQLGLN
jgi:hypothetical protein